MEGKNYEVILFDLDGTLMDTKLGITKSARYSLAHFNIVDVSLDDLEKFIGPPLHASFREFYNFHGDELEKAVKKYREYYAAKGIYESRVYPQIPLLLKKMRELNKTLMVATTKPTVFAKKMLKHFDIMHYFSVVAGSNLDGSRASKAEIIRYALQQGGITALSRTVMVGDRKYDIVGAKQVGIPSIGVLYGFGSREELEGAGATCIAKTVEDLESMLI